MLPRVNLVFDRKGETNKGAVDGLLQVEVYDTSTQCRKYFAVCRIAPAAWHSTQKKVIDKNLTPLQIEALRVVRAKIDSLILDCSRSGATFSLSWLEIQYKGGYDRENFVQYFDKYMKDKECTASTKENYLCTLRHLERFNKGLTFGGLTAVAVEKFTKYMTVRGLATGTITKTLAHIRCVWYAAKKQRIIGATAENPFESCNFNIKPLEKVKYLEFDEFRKLEEINRSLLSKRQIIVLDMYLFGCCTGLRISDIQQLTDAHFSKDKDGNLWLSKLLQKTKRTGKTLKFCLSDFLDNRAVKLYEKYCIVPNVPLFDTFSNSYLNTTLSRIFDKCGIGEGLTFHSSRHTFAMLLYNESNLELSTVQYLLGHSNIKTTDIYAKMKDTKILNLTKGVTLGGATVAPTTTNKPQAAVSN